MPLQECFTSAEAQPPLPLQEFLPAQPPSPDLHPPLPLHAFWPLQTCLSEEAFESLEVFSSPAAGFFSSGLAAACLASGRPEPASTPAIARLRTFVVRSPFFINVSFPSPLPGIPKPDEPTWLHRVTRTVSSRDPRGGRRGLRNLTFTQRIGCQPLRADSSAFALRGVSHRSIPDTKKRFHWICLLRPFIFGSCSGARRPRGGRIVVRRFR